MQIKNPMVDYGSQFNTVFRWLCLFAVLDAIFRVMSQVNEWYFLGSFSSNPWLDSAFFTCLWGMSGFALWISIGLTFNAMRAAIIALAITMSLLVFGIINFHIKLIEVPRLVDTVLTCIPPLAFGAIFFKDLRALYFPLISIAITGTSAAVDPGVIVRYLENLTGLSMHIKIYDESNSYYEMDPYKAIFASFLLPLNYLLLHYFTATLKAGAKNFLTFTRCEAICLNQKIDYSLVYWLLRSLFFVTATGIFLLIANMYQSSGYRGTPQRTDIIAEMSISFIIGLYICVSIYRNYIASYYIYNNKPLGWNYLLLNIPIVNFFAWIISLDKDESEKSAPTEKYSKDEYSTKGIKIFITALVFSVSVIQLITHPEPFGVWSLATLEFAIGFILLLIFLQKNIGIYLLLIAAAVIVFTFSFNFYAFKTEPPSLQLIYSLIILYPVFHFKIFSFANPIKCAGL